MQDKYKYDNSTKLYEYYEQIGEGSFSKVYRAKFLPTGEVMAVKVSTIHYYFSLRLSVWLGRAESVSVNLLFQSMHL